MIIGITGTNGAGKGTVVDYIVKKHGFVHYSVRKLIEEEIVKQDMPIDRTSMNVVGNDMRVRFGFDYWDKLIFENIQKNADTHVVLESVRNLASAKKLKTQGVVLWGVDADRKIRYERIVMRGSGTDKVSYDEFCAQEDREMSQTAEYDQNVFGVMRIVDHIFTNNGTPEELYRQVEAALASQNMA